MNYKHGKRHTRLYGVWRSMRQRCRDKNCKKYKIYGARGIKVCEEWDSFSNFYDWAMSEGYDETAPRGVYTIDRIDPNGDYEPGNCRLVDMKSQANNTRSNKKIEYMGEIKTLSEWSDCVDIPYETIKRRLAYGWSAEKTFTTPVRSHKPYGTS